MSISSMKQALDALDCINPPLNVRGMRKLGEAMRTLRQAIAEAMQQEPVAECTYPQCQATNGCVGACSKTAPVPAIDMSEKNVRVSDKWVGLTDDEVAHIADSEWEEAFVRLIEAKLKEKNT